MTLQMLQWPGEIEPFLKWLKARQPVHILEIGTGPGGLTLEFCRMALGRVISIDLPNGASSGLNETQCHERNVKIGQEAQNFIGILGDSHQLAVQHTVEQVLQGEFVDLLFIDGDHSLAGVERDYWMYRRFVRSGGWVAFHDINADAFESHGVNVPTFWRDFLKSNSFTGSNVWSVGGDWGGIGAVQV
jgi:predicted O-methyltransferase YrrM